MPLSLRIALRDWDLHDAPGSRRCLLSTSSTSRSTAIGTLLSHLGKKRPPRCRGNVLQPLYAAAHRWRRERRRHSELHHARLPSSAASSPARTAPSPNSGQLAGKRIGVTGWRDDGETPGPVQRCAARASSVEDAMWYAGRLTEAHPIADRLDGFGRPGRNRSRPRRAPDGRPSCAKADWMRSSRLSCLMAISSGGSPFRQVLHRFPRVQNARYFDDVGYVPGMHLIGIKAEIVAREPVGDRRSRAS